MSFPRGASIMLAGLLLLGGCSDDRPAQKAPISPTPSEIQTSTPTAAEGSPTEASGSECSNEAGIAANALDRVSGPLIGDVDGDGVPERVFIALDDAGPPGCQAFVVVSGTATTSAPISDWDPATGIASPTLNLLAQIDGRPGAEIVVDLAAGASTQFVGAFSVAGGTFERIETTDTRSNSPAGSGGLFAFGGSVGHLEAVDCTTAGEVILSSASPKGNRYQLERRFYSPEGAALSLQSAKTERRVVSATAINTFPEFGASPFGSCPAS
jgi:hypothetical protein